MAVRFHLDENVHLAVAHGLRRRGIDVTTTGEAGLIGSTDEEQLTFARSHERVLVTHDEDYLRLHHQGVPHAGIAYCHPRRRSIGQIVLALTALWRRATSESVRNRVEFL
ncbi:MAG: DUF5615 family PIN-like protein [Pirellulales bacterium]|jgi:hypothetical protein